MKRFLQRLRSILLSDRPAERKLSDLWWELSERLDGEGQTMQQPVICCSMCGALVRLGYKCTCGFTNAWCPRCRKIRVKQQCPVCGARTETERTGGLVNQQDEDDRGST